MVSEPLRLVDDGKNQENWITIVGPANFVLHQNQYMKNLNDNSIFFEVLKKFEIIKFDEKCSMRKWYLIIQRMK